MEANRLMADDALHAARNAIRACGTPCNYSPERLTKREWITGKYLKSHAMQAVARRAERSDRRLSVAGAETGR
jgi:uncharacterized protein YfaQ (DUF2300 family)